MSDGSVTHWIEQLDSDAPGPRNVAQQELWNRYFERLVLVARRKLGVLPRRAKDEEDVVLSAMKSFYQGAAEGRFPDLRDRNGLWPLLVKITIRKALNQVRDERAGKRGGGKVRGDSLWANMPGKDSRGGLADHAVGHEPTPEFAVEVAEQCQRLLDLLPDDTLRDIATLKLHGFTTTELAKELNISPRTVERRLQSIRNLWSESGHADG